MGSVRISTSAVTHAAHVERNPFDCGTDGPLGIGAIMQSYYSRDTATSFGLPQRHHDASLVVACIANSHARRAA